MITNKYSAKTMLWYRDIKIFYATLALLFEVDFLVNTGAMVSKRSSIFVAQDPEDLKALEICTARNQMKITNLQRPGSLFGNFTRHHKKAHRRRKPSSTSPNSVTQTTMKEDYSTEVTTGSEFTQSTDSNLSTLRPLSISLDRDYKEEVAYVNSAIGEVDRDRHSKLNSIIDKELLEELDEISLAKSMVRAKKMYRHSATSAVNKISEKGAKPIFITKNCTTVVAQIGTTAVLHCEVSDITENRVTWMRRTDRTLLSIGLITYSADTRFFSGHGYHAKDWALHIKFSESADAGFYECQVPTHPPTSIFFKLVLVAAYAEILGESEKIIHEGSMLKLVCVVKKSTETPSYIFWYLEKRMINYDLSGVNVRNSRHTSELVIEKAEFRHAGNYTCEPANARPAIVTVHIVESETPAAMQDGNSSSTLSNRTHMYINLLIILLTLKIIVTHY